MLNYMSSDIIYLFPYLYISKNNKISSTYINDNNITKIITTKIKEESINGNQPNTSSNNIIEYIKINKENINFIYMYNLIDDYIQNKKNIILFDDDINIIAILLIYYISKKTNISFYKCSSIIFNKLEINITSVDDLYLTQLFEICTPM